MSTTAHPYPNPPSPCFPLCRYRLLRLDHSVLGGEYIAPPDVAGQSSERRHCQLLELPLHLALTGLAP